MNETIVAQLLAEVQDLRSEMRRVNERSIFQDSIEVGTPAKGGAIKVYFNADDMAGAQRRIQNAVDLRDDANAAIAASDTFQQSTKPRRCAEEI